AVAPWVWRNHAVLGAVVPLRSNFGLELHLGNHPGASGRTGGHAGEGLSEPALVQHPYDNPVEVARLCRLGEVEYRRGHQREAADWIRAHPGEFAALTAARLHYDWSPTPDLWAGDGRHEWRARRRTAWPGSRPCWGWPGRCRPATGPRSS